MLKTSMLTRGMTLCLMGLIFCILLGFCYSKPSPGNGSQLVPDEETAVKIAEAIWLPLYGEDVLKEKPYIASASGDSVWVVKGTLHSELGGVAYIEISMIDCRILKVTHGK